MQKKIAKQTEKTLQHYEHICKNLPSNRPSDYEEDDDEEEELEKELSLNDSSLLPRDKSELFMDSQSAIAAVANVVVVAKKKQ